MIALCEYLPWDSEFFGYRIAKVTSRRLSLAQVVRIEEWCAQNDIECLYLLADSDHDETVLLAEQNAFHLVDVRITLMLEDLTFSSEPVIGTVFPTGIQISFARPSDVPDLEAIARTAHTDTRFYYDHNFPRTRCSDLYATWIKKSCEGYADAVLIALIQDQPVGYITCCGPTDLNNGHVGLVAVSQNVRGQGIGQLLLASAKQWFTERAVSSVHVVTQGRNISAQRLYQRNEFMFHSLHLWYHRWFTAGYLVQSKSDMTNGSL